MRSRSPALLLACCAVLLVGCALEDGGFAGPRGDAGRTGAGEDADGRSGPGDSGGLGLSDAGGGAVDGGIDGISFGGLSATPEQSSSPDESDGGAPPLESPSSEDGAADDPATCYDGVDDDGADGVDCDDPDCWSLGSCCVGDGDCCAPLTLPDVPTSLDFVACEGMAIDACRSAVTPFGDPLPRVEGDVLVPGGDAEFDSGIVVGGSIDLSVHRLRIETTLYGAEECGLSCLEAAGVALTTQDGFGDATHVRPLAGLLLGGSDAEVRLIVADDVVARWPMEDPMGEAWALVVRPTGEVSAERDGVELPGGRARLPVPAAARLVLYGRSRARPSDADPLGVRIGAVSVAAGLCDVPGAWTSRASIQPTTPAGTALPLDRPSGPSIAAGPGGQRLLAFAHEGDLWLAAETEGEYAVADPEVPAVSADMGEVASDPELAAKPGGGWALFYTVATASGGSRLARVDFDEPGGPFEPVPLPGLSTSTALDQPTVAVHVSGTWVLVAREQVPGGHRFVGFVSETNGEAWQRIGSGDLQVLSHPENQLGIGVGADEIGAPSLLIFGRAWHLYYARRVGTRWSIGLMASDELLWWRAVDAEVLTASGNGFDRLGVRDPDAAHTNGGEFELFYTGDDGVRTALGRAVRPASPGARFPTR